MKPLFCTLLVVLALLAAPLSPALSNAAAATISGTMYLDEGVTTTGAGETVRLIVNGVDAGSGLTDASGAYSITASVSAGDAMLVFLDGGTIFGTTCTVSDGADLSGLDMYDDHLIVRHDNGGSLTIANMDTALGSISDADIKYVVIAGVLVVDTPGELYIPAGHSFTPAGDIAAEDVKILGTFVGGSEKYTIENNWIAGAGTIIPGTSTVSFTKTMSTFTPGPSPYYNVEVLKNNGSALLLGSNLDVDNNLDILNGQIDVTASNYSVTVAGDLTNYGDFFPRNGTVTLDGVGQSIFGSSTFYNLTKSVASSETLTFEAGFTQTINGTITLNGAAGNLLALRSSSPGTRWNLDINAGATKAISFVDVQDGDASPSDASQKPIAPASSLDNGNNVGWFGSVTLSGTVYSDEGVTPAGAGKTVRLVANGSDQGTVVTDASGFYNFPASVIAGDAMLVYLDGESFAGTTVTVSNGLTLTGLDIYGDRVVLRHDNGGSLSNADMDTAVGGFGDPDIEFSISAGELTVSNNNELYVWPGHAFAPGANIASVDDVDVRGTFVGGSNTFTILGNWDAGSGAFTANTSTLILTAGSSTFTAGTSPYYNVRAQLNNGATLTLGSDLDVDNNLTIVMGSLDVSASNYSITVGGDFANSDTFVPRNGTVMLDGVGQSILGSTTFFNFTKTVASAETLTFEAGETHSFNGMVTLGGAAANLLALRSSVPGTPWNFTVSASAARAINYVDVQDSDASLSDASQIPIDPPNSVDSGNNTAWFDTGPKVVSAIPDTTLSISNPPIANYRDLNNVFTDAEDGGALAFVIQSNSNPALINVAIDADSALDLTVTPSQTGNATVVVRATDSGLLFVEDTFVVTVDTIQSTVTLVDSAGTSYPLETTVGDPSLALRIGLNNQSATGVTLDITSKIIFTDGSNTYQAVLANPTYVPANATGFTVTFGASAVPAALTAPASYDLELQLSGADDNSHTYTDTLLTTGRNSIFVDVPKVKITSIPLQTEISPTGRRNAPILALNFENEYGSIRSLDSLLITNFSSGPGNQAQLDAEIETLFLYDDVDSSLGLSVGDVLVTQATLVAGQAQFLVSGGWGIPAMSNRALIVTADVDSFLARDSDLLDAVLLSPMDVVFQAGTVIEQDFSPLSPLNSFGNLIVDGMMAHQLGLAPSSLDTLVAGSVDNWLLTIDIPDNGYEVDTLTALAIKDYAADFSPSNFASIRLFRDNGNSTFEPAVDTAIGTLVFSGSQFDISGISELLNGNVRFFVAGDIDTNAVNGNHSQPGVPVDGIAVFSANDGPIDAAVVSGKSYVIQNTETVNITNLPLAAAPTNPGDVDVPLLFFSIRNNTLQDLQLDTLNVSNTSFGVGSQADLDNSLSDIRIYQDNGNGTVDGGDVLVMGGLGFAAGSLTVTNLNFDVLQDETRYLLIVGDIDSTCSADADVMQVEVSSTSDVGFDQMFTINGAFPLASPAPRTIDGMLAFQIAVYPTADSVVVTSGTDLLMLDFGVPTNGYQVDTLDKIEIENIGTATTEHFDTLALFIDGGDNIFDAGSGDDVFAGNLQEDLTKPGGRAFKIDNLGLALTATCGGQVRFYVAADIGLDYSVGGTIQFSIPTLGLTVATDNDGPIDGPVTDPSTQIIPKPDQLTIFPYSVGDKSVYPGTGDNLNFGIGFYNGYVTPLVLQQVKLFQIGTASSTEMDSVRIYADVDTNGLFDPMQDSLLTSVPSTGASYTFDNLNLTLGSQRLSYVFVSYDLPLVVTDSVSIDLQLFDAQSLVMDPPGIETQGEFPINSPGIDWVDGMVAAQIGASTAPPFTAAANDQDVLAMALTIPSNGLWSDVLRTIEVRNNGTAAAATDITTVRVWKESGGDPLGFDPADDTLFGILTWNGATWSTAGAVNEPIPLSGLRTYVTFSVSGAPTDGVTFQGEIPVDGIQVASGNDGPIDQPVTNIAFQEISTDPLITSISTNQPTYSIGQTVTVTMLVRNEGVATLFSISPSVLASSGSGSATLTSGPTPASMDLLAGEDSTFVWSYTAQSAGDVTLSGLAQTGDSLTVSQNSPAPPFQIQNRAGGIPLALANRAPASANLGQDDVQLLDISVDYQSGDSTFVPLDFQGIKVTIEDGAGAPLPPNQVLEKAILTAPNGSDLVFSVVDSVSNPLHLYLPQPIVIQPGAAVSIKANCDISSTASFTPFRIDVAAIGDIRLFDSNDGAPITVTSSDAYPWKSTLITINTAAESLLVSSNSGQTITSNTGQNDLSIFAIDLVSTGGPNTASEILTDLTLSFVDTFGAAITPNSVVREVTLISGSQTLAISDIIPSIGSSMTINLSTPLILAPNTPETVNVRVDVAGAPAVDGFQLLVENSTAVVGRDINTNKLITVVAANPVSSDFPFASDIVVFQSAASGVSAQFTNRMPPMILPFSANVPIMDVTLTHADTSSASTLRADSIALDFRTSLGNPVFPGDYFSSLLIMHGTDTVCVNASLSSINSLVECKFNTPVMIAPSSSETISVSVTSKGFFSSTDLKVWLQQQGLTVYDTNDGSRLLNISGPFPFDAGPSNLVLPSNQVQIDILPTNPGNVTTQQPGMPAFDLLVQNGLAQGFTDVGLRTVRVEVEDADGARINPTQLFGGATLLADTTNVTGVVGATDIVFNVPDSLVIVSSGVTDTLALSVDLQTSLSDMNFRFAVRDSAVETVELVSSVPLVPGTISGLPFPLLTPFTHVLGTSAEESFTNYPNPFAAGREMTTVTYYLEQKSTVTLKLYTLWGAPVMTLIDNESRDPGLHQNIVWDGRNGDGDTVNNGVYYLVLDVKGADGTQALHKRKVGVIR